VSSPPPQRPELVPRADRRRSLGRPLVWVVALLALGVIGYFVHAHSAFPSDRTPEGAYLRVALAVTRGTPEEFFAYLEDAAQHACFTLRDYRARALVAAQSYPEAERRALEARFGAVARASDGPAVFAHYAAEEGWLEQLRADMSGVGRVEISGERATVETTRGTRYSFRRRAGGIWGMTAFTPVLFAEAERAARDLAVIERAAADYARGPGGPPPPR
jgi:hypothetical protein